MAKQIVHGPGFKSIETIFTREDGTYGWYDATWNDGDGIHYKTEAEAVTAQKKYAEEIL